MAPTVFELLKESEERLSGLDSPRLSAEVLLAEVLGCTRLSLVIDRDRALDDGQLKRFNALMARRETGEPLAYILGRKEFYSLDFAVTPDVLIPRPETEHIIEAVEEFYTPDAQFHFADLGTGSGIIAVTLAHEFSNSTGVAVDLSRDALSVARRNAEEHGVSQRLEFIEGDFTKPLFENGTFDLIVSNPPYVPQKEYDDASREVTDFEPITALVSGDDGLDHIRDMLPRVSEALKKQGRFLMEIGYRQAKIITRIIAADFPEFEDVRVIKDLSGHDRIIFLQKL